MTALASSPWPVTIPALVDSQLTGSGDDGAAFLHRRGRVWRAVSVVEAAEQVRATAAALIALDLPAGGTVAVVGRESVAGHVVVLAAQCLGIATLSPLDVHMPAGTLAAALGTADVAVVVSTDAEAARAVHECGHHVPSGFITIDPDPDSDWSTFLAAGADIDPALVEAQRAAVHPDQLAVVLIAPDGRPWSLTQGAAAAVARTFVEASPFGHDDTVYVTEGVPPGVQVGLALAHLVLGFSRVIPHAPGTGSELRDAKPTVLVAETREVRALHQRMLGSGPLALEGRQLERALDAAAQMRRLTQSGDTPPTALRRRALPITEAAAFLGARLSAVRVVGGLPEETVEFYSGLGTTVTELDQFIGVLEAALEPHGAVGQSLPGPSSPNLEPLPRPNLSGRPAAEVPRGRSRPAPPRPGESLLDALLRVRREQRVEASEEEARLPVRAPAEGRRAEIRSAFAGVSSDSRSDAAPPTRTKRGARDVRK